LILLLVTFSIVNALSGIKVDGNKLVDDSGKTVVLHGVDRSGAEFMCIQGYGFFDGPVDQNSINVMKSWKINAVRVPLNEDCWLNINGVKSQYGGANYQNAIKTFVELLAQNNLYVIIDLHWTAAGNTPATQQTPMPNRDHSIDFWKSVATFFKGNNYIIFDLFNEPYPGQNTWDSTPAWECWRDGGDKCAGLNFAAAGFQELVTAIRGAGSTNVLMLGGLAYSNSLAQWIKYVPNDPLKQLTASWHSYNFNYCKNETCWDSSVGVVAKSYPVITGEFGEDDCGHGYADALMRWADKNGVSYLGWTWNTWDCRTGPALISNYDGTATAYGQGLKAHLASL